MILDAYAKASGFIFTPDRYASVAKQRIRNKPVIFCKPSTYMNLSGKAVRYWLDKELIERNGLLVIMDDISLPLGTIRIKPSGGDAGHNGLKSINELLGTQQYARMRIGIGNNFSQGRQSDYVLGSFSDDEKKILTQVLDRAVEAVKTFVNAGLTTTMNKFNTTPPNESEGKDQENFPKA
jgi:PTH1 family peptidyl-tRNA hydrolase